MPPRIFRRVLSPSQDNLLFFLSVDDVSAVYSRTDPFLSVLSVTVSLCIGCTQFSQAIELVKEIK